MLETGLTKHGKLPSSSQNHRFMKQISRDFALFGEYEHFRLMYILNTFLLQLKGQLLMLFREIKEVKMIQ